MSRNVVKFYNASEQENKKVIDTNARMEIILQEAIKAEQRRQAEAARQMAYDEGGEPGEFVEGLGAAELDALMVDTEAPGNVIKSVDASENAETIIQEAQAKADEIVATAEQLAEEYKTNTRRETEIECNRLRMDARNEGYDSGIAQARDEYADRMAALDAREREMAAEYEELCATLETRLVSTLTTIYEHVFNVGLEDYEPLIATLLSGTMHRVESSKAYIIHVSEDDYENISQNQRSILEDAAPGCTVEVVSDIGLKHNQCLLETDNGVFDCGLDTQLSEIRRKLQLLSFDPNAETIG